MGNGDEVDKDDIADALERLADGLPDKPQRPLQPTSPSSAAEFRRPSRPAAPESSSPPPPPAPAKPKPVRPDRPDRPDRPAAPPSTAWSEEEAALVQSHYEPLSEVIDDDDAVIVPAPEPEVFAPHAPPRPKPATGPTGIRSLVFRRTVIPILLTCGVLLIGIGALRWVGGADSIFADMSIPLSATLCGCGMFLLLVAVLNMLQVKGELAAAARRRA